MISLVCVYNDAAKLASRLQAGLARQTVPHQLICVDNRDGRFPGAAAALNWGARHAVGEWVAFVHQDVQFLCDDWLQRAQEFLSELPPGGWHGVVGRTHRGRWRGLLRDRAMVFGEPFSQPLEMQTLDELLLIRRNQPGGRAFFDEGVPGWHAYGVEACCSALRQGERNFILPLPVWHDSSATNQAGLRQAHAYVWRKHHDAFACIFTTCGVLPHPYGWSRSYRVATLLRRLRDCCYPAWLRVAGARAAFRKSPWEVLEDRTRRERLVDCLHAPMRLARLEAVGFTDRTRAPRRIAHHFEGFRPGSLLSDCVVIAPELARDLQDIRQLPGGGRRLIICLYLGDKNARPGYWRRVLGRSFHCSLAMEADQTRWAILDSDTTPGAPGGFPNQD
jgi:hypothetical protein